MLVLVLVLVLAPVPVPVLMLMLVLANMVADVLILDTRRVLIEVEDKH